jgi:hypothetical protein
MKRLTMIALGLVAIAGCTNKGDYAEVARRVNPVVLELKEPGKVIVSFTDLHKPDDLEPRRQACLKAAAIASRLDLDIATHDVDARADVMGLHNAAADWRGIPSKCRDAERANDCDCALEYTKTKTAVTNLHKHGADLGVQIENL